MLQFSLVQQAAHLLTFLGHHQSDVPCFEIFALSMLAVDSQNSDALLRAEIFHSFEVLEEPWHQIF